MRKSINIHKYIIYFMLFSLFIPLIVLGITNSLLFFDSLGKEILQEDKVKVSLLSNSIRDYIRSPIIELNIIKESLESGLNNDGNFICLLKALKDSQEDIERIEITNKQGEILYNYPNDNSLLGTDVSGYDYYKKSLQSSDPLWSSTFLSSRTEAATVTLSQAYNNGVITLYITIKRIEKIIDLLEQERTKRVIFITDQKGVYIFHPDENKVIMREHENLDASNNGIIRYNGKRYYTNRVKMPETGWHINLYTPFTNIYEPILKLLIPLCIVFFIVLTVSLTIGKRFRDRILNGVKHLLELTQEIYKGNYNIEVNNLGLDELNQLGGSIVDMSKGIFSRESALRNAKDEINNHKQILEDEVELQTRELRSALESLHLAQDKIIESEKMVSLGNMVAGIAHEINTPIGIIVTASSYLNETTDDLLLAYNSNSLSQNKFKDYCENVISTTTLILSNSKRSADLISSFKQVAVDQTSDDLRVIMIKDYIESIIRNLHPEFKQTNIKISLECSTNYKIETYPGAIAQILSNLILNSIKHGFDNLNKGDITIIVEFEDDFLRISFSDNGIGISEEHLKKIYEPFFTTKRSSGGSGLGMHIVYNLVTQKLNGTVDCISQLNIGTRFELKFPVRIV